MEWDHTFSYTYFHFFLYNPNEAGDENSSRRTLLKDREVEAVPAPTLLLQFILFARK